jgi:hypothetical protein
MSGDALTRVGSMVIVAALLLVACGGNGDTDESAAPSTSSTAAPATTSEDSTTSSAPADRGPLGLTVAVGEDPRGGLAPLEVTLTNHTEAEVTVVRPFVTPHFVVFGVIGPSGEEIPFDGPYPRLEPLTDADVAVLAPGESVSAVFDLADHFALPRGELTVTAEYRAREVHHGGLATTIDPDDPVVADPLTIEVAP